jgi:hypothetical protein
MALVGLRWHRATKHNIWPDKGNVAHNNSSTMPHIAQLNVDSKAKPIVQKVAEKPKEKAHMEQETNEQIPHYCTECRQKEYKIVDLEHELSQAQKSNAALQEQIDENRDRPIEIPDLNTVIAHCESGGCGSHARQWGQIKARIVQNAYDNLPPDAIPDKVVESEGLRRGLIPKRIIIPGRFVRDN